MWFSNNIMRYHVIYQGVIDECVLPRAVRAVPESVCSTRLEFLQIDFRPNSTSSSEVKNEPIYLRGLGFFLFSVSILPQYQV